MAGLTFLLMFLVLMSLIAIVPQILKKVYVPTVISIMIIGMVIGPDSFNLLRFLNELMGRGFPTERLYFVVEALGLLGLIFLMILAGLEVDLKIILLEKKAVLLLSVLTFIIPALAGYYVYEYFKPADFIGKLFYASLFASHSVGIVFPIIKELNIVKTRFGVAILSSTVITDLLSLILLAVCVQLKRHSISKTITASISIFDKINPEILGNYQFFILFFLSIVFYIIFILWIVPKISQQVFKRFHPNDDLRLTFFLFGSLLIIFIGELIGVNIIVGAFLAGMALYKTQEFHKNNSILHQKIEGAGYGIMIPFLFLNIGMKTDVMIIIAKWENIMVVILTVAGLVGSKVISGWAALNLAGFSNKKSVCAGLMTVPQLSATLAAAAVGLELNIIDKVFFNSIVFLSIVTTIPVPILIKIFIEKGNIKFDSIEDKLNIIKEPENKEDSDKNYL
ncbi:MAG TPA: cation:proton antiporter [bacterium]|nr:cation:proton antiporter [bacterium]HPN29676.1 cation:proton antiporter [bacterium]